MRTSACVGAVVPLLGARQPAQPGAGQCVLLAAYYSGTCLCVVVRGDNERGGGLLVAALQEEGL